MTTPAQYLRQRVAMRGRQNIKRRIAEERERRADLYLSNKLRNVVYLNVNEEDRRLCSQSRQKPQL